jgi:hypothetical protein
MRVNTKVVSDIQTGEIISRVAEHYRGKVARALGVSRMLGFFSNTILASPALAAETAICTIPGFEPPSDTDTVLLLGWLAATVGTSGVTTRVRVRQGSGTGGTTVADTGLVTAVAATLITISIQGIDTPGIVNLFQYTMTLIVGSGAAVSTVSQACLFALCL